MPDANTKPASERHFFRASAADFKKIPGSPIAYWVSEKIESIFGQSLPIGTKFEIRAGICTGHNEVYILNWHEIDKRLMKNGSEIGSYSYAPHNKGGEFRKWAGNREHILKYSPDHIHAMQSNVGFRHDGKELYFKPHVGWSKITSAKSSFRFFEAGFTFDSAGLGLFSVDRKSLMEVMLFLNSKLASFMLSFLNPTLNVTPQIIKRLPFVATTDKGLAGADFLCELANRDWDAYETSWDFANQPLLNAGVHHATIKGSYALVCSNWQSMTAESLRLEEENNRIFIDAYGLQDELTPEVPLEEITLTCNPVYRYGAGKTEVEYERLQREDTMKELISYAVGCMMGRFSPDTPGLQFAGGVYDHEKACAAAPRFHPDADGILPVLSEAYFEDDVTARFAEFLKATFWPEHLSENLRFVAEALGIKGSESPQDAIRRFLANDFFKYHTRMYKKRPIYWLFSSGKERAFQALVYLHRYTPATLARMRTGYLHELQNKMRARAEDLEADKDAATSTAQSNRIGKEITKLRKQLEELRLYDEKLHHYADQRIEIDLDDGVKHNYGIFGDLLADVKAITGDKG